MKKIIAVIVAVVAIIGCFNVVSFAGETDEDFVASDFEETYTEIDLNNYPGERYLGDLDGDYKISIGDARAALRIVIGLDNPAKDSRAFCSADIDDDGVITMNDVRHILRVALGAEEPVCIDEPVEVEPEKDDNIPNLDSIASITHNKMSDIGNSVIDFFRRK